MKLLLQNSFIHAFKKVKSFQNCKVKSHVSSFQKSYLKTILFDQKINCLNLKHINFNYYQGFASGEDWEIPLLHKKLACSTHFIFPITVLPPKFRFYNFHVVFVHFAQTVFSYKSNPNGKP